ncbi:DUF2062 domain-containing protein [Roseibium aquae]
MRLTATPHAIAIGFAAGAFASFTPLIGFHFLLSFSLAWVLRGNLIAAAFGTAVGNPLTFPLIWASTYQLGHMILNLDADVPGAAHAELHSGLFSRSFDSIWPVLKPMFIGAIPMGTVTGIVCYYLVYKSVEVYQRRRQLKLDQRRAQNLTDVQDPAQNSPTR